MSLRSFSFNNLNLRGPLSDIYRLHATEDSVLGESFLKGNLNNFPSDQTAEIRETMEERDGGKNAGNMRLMTSLRTNRFN